ncbi:hypothetical protein LXA43DRAFT_989906 [Ganoderma leucocontextum]|nr:hypothetical protein LXA43DRAFT_989906 [Ganoderma leucocontextum]
MFAESSFIMSWSLLRHSPASGKTYARPLGLNEHSFYFDRVFNGTADIVWRYLVEDTDRADGPALFNESNVCRAWSTLKQWYPLLGAHMDDSRGVDAVRFVVSERNLSHHHPDEVNFLSTKSSEDVETYIWMLQRDKPTQDHHLISRLFIFKHEGQPGKYQVLIRVAHAIGDGISGATIARTFFDVLTSPPALLPNLEERLAMALPADVLNPIKKLSPPQQKWRRAIARVIFLNRRGKLAGGHTIPRTVTEKTYRTPSTTDRVGYRFSAPETVAILATCRKHGVTFGTVIPVISQLAITRMLHRRYLRGDMPRDEWEYRRRQPMHFGGPVNLRPYMDADWQRKGGATEVALAIDYYECTLPFMPSPFGSRKDDGVPRDQGAPPFAALMSRVRFLHRGQLCRQQLRRIMSNPLAMDIASARQPTWVHRKKVMATHWLAEQKGEPLPELPMPVHSRDGVPADFVLANGLSSVGQMSLILPPNYPLPQGHPLSVRTPRPANPQFSNLSEPSASEAPPPPPATSDADALLRITDETTYLHSRPMEFFLGNATERGMLGLGVTFDRNVYKTADVEEFVEECRLATLYYLGGTALCKGKL